MAQTSLSSGSTIDDKINSLLSTYQWGNNNGIGVNLTYSFPDIDSTWSYIFGTTEYTTIVALNSTYQQNFRDALTVWSDVANITFSEITESGSTYGDIRAGFSDSVTGSSAGYAYLPVSTNTAEAGDVWLNKSVTDFSKGSQGFSTLVHELGHALGLKHPFEGSTYSSTTLTGNDDSIQYSVMSYNGLHNSTNYNYQGAGWYEEPRSFRIVDPTTPMLYDIAAIQFLYGANMNTNTENTRYEFETTAELKTIWDAGGTDIFDLSNQTYNQIINLNEGNFSSIGSINWKLQDGTNSLSAIDEAATDNIAIAYGVEIENAIGGSGNDSITGNDLNNELSGGGGNDTIDGGNGNDTAVYSGNKSDYTISNNSSDISVSSSTEGSDTLSSIEYLKFNDGTFDALTLENIDTTSGNTDPIIPTKPTTPAEVVKEITEAHSYNYFLLQIDSALPNDASVSYTTRDVTAEAGEDYVAANGTATIKAGELSTIITIEILEDAIVESDETFELVLSNPVGASFPEGITEITASRTIIDDDVAITDQDELIILGSTMDDYAV